MKISIFDLDNTLIRTNSSFQFCRYLYRKNVFSLQSLMTSVWYRLKYEFLGLSLIQLHQAVFEKILKGFSLEILEKHVPCFLEEFLEKDLYLPAYAELKKAKAEGQRTGILSNSPAFLVSPIAQFFGVDFWKATEYGVDKDKCLCNIAILMEGGAKAAAAEEMQIALGIAKEDMTGYTDSHADLPLLKACGNRVAVNPDRKLKRLALKQKWRVI